MKKIFSLLLAAAMILSAIPVLAAETSELEAAILDVKSKIDVEGYEEFVSRSLSYRGDDVAGYDLTWSNPGEEIDYISVTYSDGQILSYNKPGGEIMFSEAALAAVKEKEARQIADDFVKKVCPEGYENIKISEDSKTSISYGGYSFTLQRMYNNIPVCGQNGRITVSKKTGEVLYYKMSYDTSISFEDTESIIDTDTAKEEYIKKISPALCYDYYYDYKKEEVVVFPKYKLQSRNLVIDAKTADVYEAEDEDDLGIDWGYAEKGGDAMYQDLTDAERAELSKIGKLISAEKAEEIARSKKSISINDEYVVELTNLERSYINKNQYEYRLLFVKSNDDTDSIMVEIDGQDGTIISFYKTGEYGKEAQNKENEIALAKNALSELTGDKYKNLEYQEDKELGTIRYVRKENGIEVIEDGAEFSFDSKDNIVSYNLQYTDIAEFPSVENVLSCEDVVGKIAEQIDFSLLYVVDSEKGIAKPAYAFYEDGNTVRDFSVNPFTGKEIDFRGEEVTSQEQSKFSYSDIAGHYAEDKITELAENGIGFEGGKLFPAQEITQSEYVMLLDKIFGYTSDIDAVYSSLFRYGFMSADEREDQGSVTREKAAILMARHMGAEEFVKYDNIFVSPFADVTENKGYIALLKAMGIVSGDQNGNFNPKNTITRAEALVLIYNYLTRS